MTQACYPINAWAMTTIAQVSRLQYSKSVRSSSLFVGVTSRLDCLEVRRLRHVAVLHLAKVCIAEIWRDRGNTALSENEPFISRVVVVRLYHWLQITLPRSWIARSGLARSAKLVR